MINFIKKYKLIILFVVIVIFTGCYTCFFCGVYGDEVWNYGFSYNISKGMVIYRDFNVLQTPLYFMVGSIFIKIFGNYLFSLHILDAILIAIIVILLFKMIGWKSFIVYAVMLIMPVPSYNLFCLFWLFLILYLIHEKKDRSILIGFLISLLFLTKQSIGICVFCVYFIYSKHKLKSMICFAIPIFLLCIYLIYHQAFYSFINYCFFGLFDFGEKNSQICSYTLLIFEILIIIYLIYRLIKSHFKDKETFYVLAFQVAVYPIVDMYHFLVGFAPVVYLVIQNLKIMNWGCLFLLFLTICVFSYKEDEIHMDHDYLYLRRVAFDFSEIEEVYYKYLEGSTYQFLLFYNTYSLKLHMNIPITKYDFMIDGNMGYRGYEKYIAEIEKMCSAETCVFFVDEDIRDADDTQFSREVFDYVVNNYSKIEEYCYFSVYSNKMF